MRTFELFTTIREFRELVPGIDASTTLESMQPSFERASRKIKSVITPAIWDSIKEANDKPEAKLLLQSAVGNLIASFHHIIRVAEKKKEGVNFYKYELQTWFETYLDNYATYMDALLDYLDAKKDDFEGWAETETYKLRQTLLLKTADEFNKVFATGGSAYFFHLTCPLQEQVLDDEILPRVKIASIPAASLKTVKRLVAYRVMAMAVEQFDSADLPKSLRQKLYVDDSKNKHGGVDPVEIKYINSFNAKADGYLKSLDIELNKPPSDVTDIYVPEENINDEDNPFFVSC